MSDDAGSALLFGLLFGGPVWALVACALMSIHDGAGKVRHWWKYSPPEREAARRKRKRDRLEKKLAAL